MHAPETLRGDTVILAENVGAVPVRFNGASFYGEMTQRDPEFGAELDPAEVARLIGLELKDLDPAVPPQSVSTGTAFAVVALRSAGSLAKLRVDQLQATPWLRERGARWFYVLGPDGNQQAEKHNVSSNTDWRARMQFYGGEDPATGSAAGCAIGHLVARGAVPSEATIHLRQGVEIGRPSDLFLSARKESARVTDVRVAGSTVLVANGKLFLR